MTPQRSLRGAASLAVAALLLTVLPQSATGRTINPICEGDSAIPASALTGGASHLGCSLVGRTVVAGRLSAVVPPDGMSVAGSGISASGEVAGLQIDNRDGVVRVTRGGAAGRSVPVLARKNPCKDRTFHIYGASHHWVKPMHWTINLAKAPKRDHKNLLVKLIRKGNTNMRTGHNSCGKKPIDTPRAFYGGRSKVKPHIIPNTSNASCGSYNPRSVVGFGPLPGLLFGWTCFWWTDRSGHIDSVNIMLGQQKKLVTKLPHSCSYKWDLEGIATHEWGHGYGLAHTGPGHATLTMQHIAAPCSTYQRTLGLGDWLGLKKLYGVR